MNKEQGQEQEQDEEIRIPFYIESERGDDKLGTGPDGKITSDAKAAEQGAEFKEGVPESKIEEAVTGEIKKDNWVTVEKADGSTDLLTKHDLPENETKALSWKDAFNVQPAPKEMSSKLGGHKTPASTPRAAPTPAAAARTTGKEAEEGAVPAEDEAEDQPEKAPQKGQCSTPAAKEKKEVWTSRFKDVKSATATHQVKPG